MSFPEEVSGAPQESPDAGRDTLVQSCHKNKANNATRNNSSAPLWRPPDREALERRELVGTAWHHGRKIPPAAIVAVAVSAAIPALDFRASIMMMMPTG